MGKHPLSPEEGPTTNGGQGCARQEPQQYQTTLDTTQTYPPPLVVTDEEVIPAASLGRAGHNGPALVYEPRKLKRTETLITVDSAESAIQSGNSSTDTDTSTNTNTDTGTDTDDLEEEVTNPTKVTGFSQRVMSERPPWLGADALNGHGHGERHSAPDSVPTPSALDHSTSQSYSQAGGYYTRVDSDAGTTSKSSRLAMPSSFEGIGPMSSNSVEPGSPVCRGWPAETDLSIPSSGRMKLWEQTQVIRDAITASFPFLRALIIIKNAFPNGLLTMTFIKRVLVDGTSYNLDATHICTRILNNHVYLAKIAQLLQARISIFQAEVKERCAAAVALLVNVHDKPMHIADLIETQLQDNFNYIFPRRSLNANILSASARRSQPYRCTVIILVIRDLFFTGPVPFATWHQDLFPPTCGSKETTNREVPKVMVALVSTAYYAALKEWSTGEHKHLDFSANSNLDVYNGHMRTLNEIESLKPGPYHRMMVEIYNLASSTSIPSIPVPSLDISVLEFED